MSDDIIIARVFVYCFNFNFDLRITVIRSVFGAAFIVSHAHEVQGCVKSALRVGLVRVCVRAGDKNA